MQPRPTKRRLVPGSRPHVAPKKRVTNHVYFLSCHGFIKIGTAACARARHRAVQTVSPFEVRLLCAIPGNADLERSLHQRFWYLHERGEWFRVSSDLNKYIAECREKTKAANFAAYLSVAVCDGCGGETMCRARRKDVEAAVIPMQFFRDMTCIMCTLAEARQPPPGVIAANSR